MNRVRVAVLLAAMTSVSCSLFEDARVTLAIADAPVDGATAIVLQFSRVVLVSDEGKRETIRLAPPQQVDLLQFTGGGSHVLLTARAVGAGRYRSVELQVDGSSSTTESYVDLPDGGRLPLFVPETSRSALKIPADFSARERKTVNLTVDADLRRSIYCDAPACELRPVFRLVEDERSGRIAGTVATALLSAADCSPAIYAFSGGGVIPDDVDGVGAEPLSSALVRPDSAGQLAYAIGFLEAGTYTLALTCDATRDEPGWSDDIEFLRTRTVVVEAQRTRTANFE